MTRSIRFTLFAACLIAIGTLVLHSRVAADESPLYGYSPESSRAERQWEEKLRAIPSPANLRAYMERLSAHPHHVGSPHCHAKFTAKLEEPALPQDPTSSQKSEQLPTYNVYSSDGEVTAPLVYVNYGIPEDYERLERLGVSVKGAIVIARYGHSWRGVKPKVAAEHGAVACLIYSDPHEDGYFQGKTFPDGPYRPGYGAQRGSVADMSKYPGDPLTPGIAAKKDAKRLAVKDSPTLTKIPVMPISYADAEPLIAALQGPVSPVEWRGNLPVTYHVGPSALKAHFKVNFNWQLKPIYDVIAKIPGSSNPDEWIIRGNHHDAWVNGAEDPISGLVAELEEARALGELVKAGWKPKRTIIYCAWDGEEPGLLGSTEWVEDHLDELRKHAVAYINSDSNGRGFLALQGSHTLEKFINEIARDVQDPETKLSVWKRLQLNSIAPPSSAEARQEARTRGDLRIGPLGSGSDYGAFLQHAGVASLDISFQGEDGGGIYHSIYDDFYWYTHFSDTEFVYGRALAQTIGTTTMRLADADVLPFAFENFADTMQVYVKELKALLQQQQEEVRERNRAIEEGAYAAVNDPRKPAVAPKIEEVAPFINFAPLDNALLELAKAADAYKKAYAEALSRGEWAKATAARNDLNRLLIESERKLTNEDGLPGRPWFKHEIYAPGQYTGYEAKTIPGVREALEAKKWKLAEEQVGVAAKTLQAEAALITEAAAALAKI